MKRFFCLVCLIGIVIILFSISSCSFIPQTVYAKEEQQQRLLAATIQIMMFRNGEQEKVLFASGLGTLVQHEADRLIVTHDHWSDYIIEVTTIEFRDAEGTLLLTIDGVRFRNLIRYRDKGTMIFSAPNEFNTNRFGKLSTTTVTPGTMVTLVRRQQRGDGLFSVETMAATVTAVAERDARPIYMLRSMDGQPIVQGDSGGGVWWNGRFIGNMWATEMITGWQQGNQATTSWKIATDNSIAAQFPQLSPQNEPVSELLNVNELNQIMSREME